MKVYVPAIVGYVPDDIVKCLRTFMEACYIIRRQDIDTKALDHLDDVLEHFKELREVFRVPGVRPDGFVLPRMHSLFHYRRQIEDFGAPGGLCSSITESRHVTAVNKPYRRSNKYEALRQMLITNQRLDKLAAMRSDFTARGMLPSASAGVPRVEHPRTQNMPAENDNDDDDEGPVEENVLGHVSLARTRGTFLLSSDVQPVSDPTQCPNIHKILRHSPPWLANLTFNIWPRNALLTS